MSRPAATVEYDETGDVATLSTGSVLYRWPDDKWRYLAMPALPAIWTAGYGRGRVGDLFHTAKLLDAVVLDIRMAPFATNRPEWCRDGDDGLQTRFGSRYRHVAELGNINYREPAAGIEIADLARGITAVLATLERGRSPILLCGCEQFGSCHRRTVAEALAAAGYPSREMVWFKP